MPTEPINPDSEMFRDGKLMGKMSGSEKARIKKIREICATSDSFIVFAEYNPKTNRMETFTNVSKDALPTFLSVIMKNLDRK